MIGPGSPVGNFVVTQKLGEGAMGVVYLAEHPTLGRQVAVKVIKKVRPDASSDAEANAKVDQEAMSRFSAEAKALNRIRHPNIVKVEDYGVTPEGESYYVMEYLSGESLGRRLRSGGQLRLAFARHVGAQIADALEASHREGFLHRDLKPDNIFLVESGTDDAFVKILDFGLAKLMGSDEAHHRTQTGALLGTPLYMSPEQCRGQRDIDARSDVYALGVILFEMICGRAPFQGAGLTELLIKITTEQPPSPTTFRHDCPAWLADLILQALATEPSKRPRDMALVRDQLREPRTEGSAGPAPTTAPIEPTLPAAVPPAAVPPAAVPPAAVPPAAVAATAPLLGSPPPSGSVGPTSPVPASASIPTAQAVTLTHSKSDAIIAGRRKGACASNTQNEPQFTHANHFYRVFELSEFGITSEFTAERVDFGVDSAETVAGFQTVTLRLHKLSGAALTNVGLTLLHGQNVLVEDVSQTIVSVPLTTPVVVPAGSTLVLELATPGSATVGNFFYPGSNEAGETGPSYLKASACNITEPSPYTSLDATTPIHLVMRVVGRGTIVDDRSHAIPGRSSPEAGNIAADPTMVPRDMGSAGSAAAPIKKRYLIANPGQVLRGNMQPAVPTLLGALREPSRTIIAAPMCAPDTLLARSSILGLIQKCRVRARAGTSYPPVSVDAPARRLQSGLAWSVSELDREFCIGFDASFATRDRTMEDRQADGRSQARGDVGVFTTMELVVGALLFLRKLDAAIERHPAWWLRIELVGMSNRNLIFDPPRPRRGHSPWNGRRMPATAPRIDLEASFPRDLSTAEVINLANDLAGELAFSFGAEEQVNALNIGKLILDEIESA